MVLYTLYIKAEIEGVKSLYLNTTANICIDICNPLSDYEIREKVVIDPTEFLEQDESSREPPYHFGIKWEGSKKYSVLTVLDKESIKNALKKESKKGKKKGGDDPRLPRSMTEEDNETFVPFVSFECRGIEPYAFHPMGGEFIVVSEGGTTFEGEEVDLSEGDWADYDAENDISVTISDFTSKFDNL
mmetsp:Transcript_9218/g.11622  ORF Transcript_9218/g.11622 Transcript_9218/m.11622 type:complete len:187 (+) Transcript_9218:91-651(+)